MTHSQLQKTAELLADLGLSGKPATAKQASTVMNSIFGQELADRIQGLAETETAMKLKDLIPTEPHVRASIIGAGLGGTLAGAKQLHSNLTDPHGRKKPVFATAGIGALAGGAAGLAARTGLDVISPALPESSFKRSNETADAVLKAFEHPAVGGAALGGVAGALMPTGSGGFGTRVRNSLLGAGAGGLGGAAIRYATNPPNAVQGAKFTEGGKDYVTDPKVLLKPENAELLEKYQATAHRPLQARLAENALPGARDENIYGEAPLVAGAGLGLADMARHRSLLGGMGSTFGLFQPKPEHITGDTAKDILTSKFQEKGWLENKGITDKALLQELRQAQPASAAVPNGTLPGGGAATRPIKLDSWISNLASGEHVDPATGMRTDLRGVPENHAFAVGGDGRSRITGKLVADALKGGVGDSRLVRPNLVQQMFTGKGTDLVKGWNHPIKGRLRILGGLLGASALGNAYGSEVHNDANRQDYFQKLLASKGIIEAPKEVAGGPAAPHH